MRVITDKLLEPAPGSLRAKLEELREFAVSRLPEIRELLARPENAQEAHEELAECVSRLTLEATKENGKKRYLPHGKVDFFDEGDLGHSDGGGGLACTLQSPHTIQDRPGGMKPTKPTSAPAPRFARVPGARIEPSILYIDFQFVLAACAVIFSCVCGEERNQDAQCRRRQPELSRPAKRS